MPNKRIICGGELFEVFQVGFYSLSLVSFIRSVPCREGEDQSCSSMTFYCGANDQSQGRVQRI